MAIKRLVTEGTATGGKQYAYVFAPIPRIAEAREIMGEVDGVRFLNPVYFSSFPRDAYEVWVLYGSHNQEAIVAAGAKVLRRGAGKAGGAHNADQKGSTPSPATKRKRKARSKAG